MVNSPVLDRMIVDEYVLLIVDDSFSEEFYTYYNNLYENLIFVMDYRSCNEDCEGDCNPDMKIINSYKISKEKHMKSLLDKISEYAIDHPTRHTWNRTINSMVTEWILHNWSYNFNFAVSSTQHVDLDNKDEGKVFFDFIWERVFLKFIKNM